MSDRVYFILGNIINFFSFFFKPAAAIFFLFLFAMACEVFTWL